MGRVWHGLTAAAALIALSVQFVVMWRGDTAPDDSRADRVIHYFAYLTTWTVLIAGAMALTIAIGTDRDTAVWRALRLDSVVLPVVIGTVNFVMLRPLGDLHGLANLGDHLQHDVVPILALTGWIVFGPRGRAQFSDVGAFAIVPVVWVVFTFVSGAFSGWYPYPFIDVPKTGYLPAIIFCVVAASAMTLLAAGAVFVDRLVSSRPGTSTTAS
ncbi:Pr6Pr family membrane protein [Smaragdicoccus niigatensis]|uniref:Pr6Pr family membrane protein n=1 Tax=Smaragdicoccus niigatensis TaxID=359359 RepID=UPI0003648180|nr:Pr6Pr family membrane protein [Smaragdicoccus niigatensis]